MTEKIKLDELIIIDGAKVKAPDGWSLTMTIDGVENEIKPGRYAGRIVLTPTREMLVPYDGMGAKQINKYRAALVVDDGKYLEQYSAAAARKGGAVSNARADGVSIESNGPAFNGIIVRGKSNYVINSPVIKLNGKGRNDFDGVGAGIKIAGTSKVVVNHPVIRNKGAVRTGIWVGDNAVATINNAEIETDDGELSPDYGFSWVRNGGTEVMQEVPWMLGLRGNNRATMLVGNGKATYNNSHIKAHTWGAMFTDAVGNVELLLNNCRIETVRYGYGAYSNGDALVTARHSFFDVADYGLILAGGSAVLTDRTFVNSRRFGIMGHGGTSGKLVIDKKTVINAAKAAIQLKGSSPTIVIDDAVLNSKEGLLLQVMENDDPYFAGGDLPAGDMGGAPPGSTPGKYNGNDGDNNADVTVRNTSLQGDFLNSSPSKTGMKLRFEKVSLSGAISTATAIHLQPPSGEKMRISDSTEHWYLMGEQTETLAPTANQVGAVVSLDGQSNWTVTKTSYLNGLDMEQGAKLTAPAGKQLTMMVDGIATPVKSGHYQGNIVLKLSPR